MNATTMTMIDLQAMALLGLFGTGHCIGMCGPLIIAFPGRSQQWRGHAYYHCGRVLTYTLVGGAMGGVGLGLGELAAAAGGSELAWIARIQVTMSIAAALFLLAFGIARIGIFPEPSWLNGIAPSRIPGVGRLIRSPDRSVTASGLFTIGLAMGLLPCGLSFAAFARALASSGPGAGAAMTLAFGLGTLPGLLLIGSGASALSGRFRRHCDLLSGVLMIAMAVKLLVDALGAFWR
ncbi:MAG: sulfite exporter TauE/SafE family protein [Desulfobacterales bacterium]|jgi:hypothetical protein